MLTDSTIQTPSSQKASPALPEVIWWGLLSAFGVLLLILVSSRHSNEAVTLTALLAAALTTASFGVELSRRTPACHRREPLGKAGVATALGMLAAFEIAATWLAINHAPWPPPRWTVPAISIAAIAWLLVALASSLAFLSPWRLFLSLLDALLPASLLAFAAMYALPRPNWDGAGGDRLIWRSAAIAVVCGFAACSLLTANRFPPGPAWPLSIACFTLGGAGVLLGLISGETIGVVLGNAALIAGAAVFLMARSETVLLPRDGIVRAYPAFSWADLLLGPALVALTILAIKLRPSDVHERDVILRWCVAATVVLLVTRQLAGLWLQQREFARLDSAHRELTVRASLDPLTRLPNREALLLRLEEEIERARRHSQELSVCFVDIDFFKSINDRFGHAAGDLALREVAAILRRTARSIDVVGRYGGEEFLIVAPGTSSVESSILGERLRIAVEHAHIRLVTGETISLTISAGLAAFPDNARSIADLIEAADAALYASKRLGRNRVTTSEAPPAD